MRRIALVLLASLSVLWSGSLIPAHAAATSKGGFVVHCKYSHTAQDDPIVYPNQPGASHSHDFFGNEQTNSSSTYQTMVQGTSSCSVPADTAGYWVPTPYLDGTEFHPYGRVGDLRVYYRAGGARSPETIPAGLEMIGGDKAATAPPPTWEIRWYCGAGDTGTTPFSSHPYDCTPYAQQYAFVDGVVGVIDMPRCWDGTGLLPTDVVYPTNGAGVSCPSGFPHVLPLVSERVHFGVMDPCDGLTPCGPDDPDTNVRLTFSTGSGADTLPTGAYFTLHADFWNAWNQDALDTLVADCIDSHVACGFLTARYPVTVAVAGSGSGTVTSDPAALSCPGTCWTQFPTATRVTLTATPADGSVFAGWTGDCSGADPCTVDMEHAHGVTAYFQATGTLYDVAVTRTGNGHVSSVPRGISCGSICDDHFGAGVAVQLHAKPADGWVFDRWGGACAGTSTSDCIVQVVSDLDVTASFVPVRYGPDVQVRPAHQSWFTGARWVGPATYQAVTTKIRRGERAQFLLRVANAGNVADRFLVQGPAVRWSLRAHYTAEPSGAGITRRVKAGRYETPLLAPGEWQTIRVFVDVPRGTRPGSLATWVIRARSATAPHAVDGIEARVRVRR